MPFRLLTLLLALLALTSACGDEGGTTVDDPEPVDLVGDWLLADGTAAGAPMALDDTHQITLTVEGDRVSGQSACNRYLGQVTVSGDSVTFGQLGGTQMACMPETVMDLEQVYLAALQTIDAGARDGDVLTLSGPDAELVFETVPPVPPAALAGTTWVLETLVKGDVASSVLGTPATLELDDDGTATGGTGCRRFRGGWELTDDLLSLPELATTKQACDPAVDAQDRLVLAVLAGPAQVSTSGDTMSVTLADGRGLGYRVR